MLMKMEVTLDNKVVVVIGGARGIGYGITDQFLQQGAKIAIILDIDEVQGALTSKELRNKHGEEKVDFMKCDAATDLERATEIIFDKYKTVDVAVISVSTHFEEPNKMINIYLTTVIEWSLKFLEHMRKDCEGKGGTIITISSIFGFRPEPYAPVYQAAKFGINGFTKSLGHIENFEKTGVRVLAICPGFTKTRLTLNLRDPELQKMLPDDLVRFANSMPWQTVDDVGRAAVEIYKKAGSGTVWLIEGGNPVEEVP